MNFDLRIPVGLMFGLFGLLLTVYGLFTKNSDMYQKSLNLNINLTWGLVLLAFGGFMAILAWRGAKAK